MPETIYTKPYVFKFRWFRVSDRTIFGDREDEAMSEFDALRKINKWNTSSSPDQMTWKYIFLEGRNRA